MSCLQRAVCRARIAPVPEQVCGNAAPERQWSCLTAACSGCDHVAFAAEAGITLLNRAVLQLGRPFRADALVARTRGDRRLTKDVIGLAVAETLPAAYRGAYSNADRLPGAKTALRELRATA